MGGALVESSQDLSHLRWDVCRFVVVTCERANCVDRVEGHDDRVFDLLTRLQAEQVAATVAREVAGREARRTSSCTIRSYASAFSGVAQPLQYLMIMRLTPPSHVYSLLTVAHAYYSLLPRTASAGHPRARGEEQRQPGAAATARSSLSACPPRQVGPLFAQRDSAMAQPRRGQRDPRRPPLPPRRTAPRCLASHISRRRAEVSPGWSARMAAAGAPHVARRSGSVSTAHWVSQDWRLPVLGRGELSGRADGARVLAPVCVGLTLHGLRHGHQTWLDDMGIRYVLQSERMGHDVPGMRGVYSHTTPAMRAELKLGLPELWEARCHRRPRLPPRGPASRANANPADVPLRDGPLPHRDA